MKQCKKCGLPENTLYVTLNEESICNYCTHYDAYYKGRFDDFTPLKSDLRKRFDKLRGHAEYDALVGVSGGKDSLYILVKLVKEYNLNVLAFTFDNGFLTNYAKENINVAIKKIGVDHFFYTPNWELHKKLYQGSLITMGTPCDACAYLINFVSIKLCYEKNIPFFVHGRSPYQMFRNYFSGSTDSYIPMMELNVKEHSFTNIKKCYVELMEAFKPWIEQLADDDQASAQIRHEFFPAPSDLAREDFAPEFLGFFLFEPYDEEEMKKFIEKEVGYKRASNDGLLSHGDCRIHDASASLYQRIRGIPFSFPEVAAMARMGHLNLDDVGASMNKQDFAPESLPTSMNTLCHATGITQTELDKLIPEIKHKTTFPGFMW